MIKNYIRKAQDFETSRIETLKKSNKLLSTLLVVSILGNAGAAFAIAVLTPLKTVAPYVIQVDKSTGNQEVLTSLTDKSYTTSEAEDRANIARYVIAREGYVFDILQRNYDTVRQLSTDAAFENYKSLFEGAAAIDKQYGDQVIVEPRIISMSLKKEKYNDGTITSAIVRAEIVKKNIQKKSTETATVMINLVYNYDMSSADNEEERLNNPLGFKVSYYRRDIESSTPEQAVEAPSKENEENAK